jgi:hypothetical protein
MESHIVTSTESQSDSGIIAAFGAKNRLRLLNQYFTPSKAVTANDAWQHVYRLLLWTDQTTGLAHCYESDKCQPGKRWYTRSLAFHNWLSSALGSTPADLADRIDWLFQRAARELATEVMRGAERLALSAAKQRKPYEGKGFPEPGEDPELISIVREVLGTHLSAEPSPTTWAALVQRIRQYLSLDNKRKNLLGEGFEDVLGQLIERSQVSKQNTIVAVRSALHELPGFSKQRDGDKVNKVDVAVIRDTRRILVTAKWSVRADREKQFTTDFNDYVAAESSRKPFEYVFVTNEFDPARLARACENLAGNAHLFASVVHINTDALRATYGDLPPSASGQESTMRKVIDYIDAGRLVSLDRWLVDLSV